MKWQNRLDDPVPALITEMMARGAMHDTSPCSLCRASIEAMKRPGAIRAHFHASDVGACKRKVLYSMRYPARGRSNSNPIFLLDGHLHETSIFTVMELGAENPTAIDETIKSIYVVPAKNEKEQMAKIPYTIGRNEIREIVIVAHWDGFLEFVMEDETEIGRSSTYLIECKSVRPTKFAKVKSGYMDPEWYGQVQTYLRIQKLETAYLIVKNRDSSEILPPIRIDIDSNYLKKRRAALIEVHTALLDGGMVNRGHKIRKNDECRVCKFSSQCWSSDEDELSIVGENNNAKTRVQEQKKTSADGVSVLRKKKKHRPK